MTADDARTPWEGEATPAQRMRAAIARADRFRADIPRSRRPVVVRATDLEQLLEQTLDAHLEALTVPDEGAVLFVLRMPADTPMDRLHAAAVRVRAAAQEIAPGRGWGAALADDTRLEALSEDQLQRLGLARITATGN